MTLPTWKIEDNQATLQNRRFKTQILLEQPGMGLHHLQAEDGSPTNIQPLCITLPGQADLKAALSDAYVRTEDLVAVYEESSDRPFRTQIYWHAIPAGMNGQLLGGVELVVSVNTSGLDVTSEWSIHTEFPAGELLRLRDIENARYDAVSADSDKATTFRREEGPGVFLFRPPNVDWSYAEMVDVADFSEAQLSGVGEGEPQRLTYPLFHLWLEKGVIVRSRMRGVLLRRQGDEAAAVGCFEDLRHAKLPLTV